MSYSKVVHDIPDLLIRDTAAVAGSLDMDQVQDLLAQSPMRNLSSVVGKRSSQRFLITMYERLQRGEDLPLASGSSTMDVAILRADTVRSLPAQGKAQKYSVFLNFYCLN
jgi:hypothetical protein